MRLLPPFVATLIPSQIFDFKDCRNRLKIHFSLKHNCKQHMDLPPIPYYQIWPFCFTTTLGVPTILSCDFIRVLNLFISWISKKWHLQGKHQGSQLACLLEDSRQCRFRPWHTCQGSSDHFPFHSKMTTNLKVAANLLHLASLNCVEHFWNDFSCYRDIFFRRCSRFQPFNPRG